MAARLPDDNGVQTMLRVVGLAKIYPAVSGRAGAGGGDSAANSREAVGERQGAGERQENGARGEVVLFRGLEFSIAASEMVAIVGESGTGKSSLLHLLAALDRPTAGEVWVRSAQDREINLGELNAREAAEFRNREVGYVWQFHYLLPEFTALENVAMPLMARGVKKPAALQTAAKWLKEVGLEDRGEHRPGELSGGEQQRIALARALVNDPRLLLADEPTGDLDEATAGRVFDMVEQLHRSHGLTSILVTHNLDLAARCTRTLHLESGRLVPLA